MIVRDVVLDLFGSSKDPQYLMLVNLLDEIQYSSHISELRIRVSYERILRIRLCQYAHNARIYAEICAYIRAYMPLCYAFP